ncbi:peptidase [Taibaiella sp. KBW10]|uniref:M90 family metallopeptidase n=1 Tax=Taibaiella sp. KBW10 TaxID=2153357 RepID=UPI000F5B3518|nr:M90 family metallopeptidase [Taibaiella sp. KBW10]RQO32046.1 peptidase [Taibaiella sp. KBW10]
MSYQLLILLLAVVIGLYLFRIYRKAAKVDQKLIPEEETTEQVLAKQVPFYQKLSAPEQQVFEERVQLFLHKIKITPINNAAVTMQDRVLIAAAGIIPLFRFKNWMYNNLNEVLVYPDRFNKDYELEGNERDVVGMVGDGAMHRTMILSLPYLRAGFANDTDSNTAIHEFVHLLDKSDGATDGIPEAILQDDNVKPWISLMHEYIKEIRQHDITDINPYGATNEAEFFAVVSEYFFQQPERLQEHHPELYTLLNAAFNRTADTE